MYKILYLTQFPEIGGGETILISLLKNLDRKKFEPIVIVPKRGQLSQRLNKLKITTYYLQLNPYLIRTFFVPGASPIGLWQLIKLCRKIKPDLIHLNHLTLAIYAGLVGKIMKIPVIATSHGLWDSIYFYQDLINQIFVDKILANTPETAKSLLRRKIINSKKVHVVPFGIDTNVFKPAISYQVPVTRKLFGLPADNFLVAIVGRLDPQKDHETYLEAAEQIFKKLPATTFLVVGAKKGDFSGKQGAYYKKIKDFLNQRPDLSQKVIFTGFIDNMPKLYQAIDILISTTPKESFGLATAEALASSIPVICTNSNSDQKLIIDRKNGYLIPPKNPQILAQKIYTLAKNHNLRTKFGNFGRKYIEDNFSIKEYVSRIQEEYIKMANH